LGAGFVFIGVKADLLAGPGRGCLKETGIDRWLLCRATIEIMLLFKLRRSVGV